MRFHKNIGRGGMGGKGTAYCGGKGAAIAGRFAKSISIGNGGVGAIEKQVIRGAIALRIPF